MREDGTPEIGDRGLKRSVLFEPEEGRLVISIANQRNKVSILCWGSATRELLSEADIRFETMQAVFLRERAAQGRLP